MFSNTQEKKTNSITGNILVTALLAYGGLYCHPYVGKEAHWISPLLLSLATLYGIKSALGLIRFWRNQWRRYKAQKTTTKNKGEAQWASFKDIRKAGLHDLDTDKVFLMFDEWGNPLNDKSSEHILIEAPTGKGKSSAFLIPNILHCTLPAFIIDPKGELSEKTIPAVKKYQGKDVIILDPYNHTKGKYGKTAATNPLDEVVYLWNSDNPYDQKKILTKAQSIGLLLMPEPKNKPNSDHFRIESIKWIVAMIVYAVTHLPKEQVNFTKILELIISTSEMENALSIMRCSDILEGDAARLAEAIQQQLDDKDSHGYNKSIRDGAVGALRFAARSGVFADAMAKSDFSFTDLKTKNVNIYLVIPFEEVEVSKPYIESVIWQMQEQINRMNCPKMFLCVFEEATLFKIPRLNFMYTGGRSYGYKSITCIQDHKEFANVYGNAYTLLSQTGIKIYMNPQSPDSMELASKSCGDRTVSALSYHLGDDWMDRATISAGEHGRRLITGNEARQSPYAILIYPGLAPIRIQIIGYYLIMPMLKWVGDSKRYFGKALVVLRYKTLHHVLRYYARKVFSVLYAATNPIALIQHIKGELHMTSVKLIRRAKSSLSPKRLVKKVLSAVFTWTIRAIEWLLPFVPLVFAIWLFTGEKTPHILWEKNRVHCKYQGIYGVKTISDYKCTLFQMLP